MISLAILYENAPFLWFNLIAVALLNILFKILIGSCEDTMVPMGDVCILPPCHWNNNTKIYREVSLAVCQVLCTTTHKTSCRVTEYLASRRLCLITQMRANVSRDPCVHVKGFLKQRCTGKSVEHT